MKIIREFLAAYIDRTLAYRERTLALNPEANVAITTAADPPGDEPEGDDPWTVWLESFGADLEPADLEEVLWARGKMAGVEPRGTKDEARAILLRRMVPRPAWNPTMSGGRARRVHNT